MLTKLIAVNHSLKTSDGTCVIKKLNETLARQYIDQIIDIHNRNHSSQLSADEILTGTIRGRENPGIWQHSVVAMLGTRVIGYSINYEREPSWTTEVNLKIAGRCLYINLVDVDTKYQSKGKGHGHGLGSALITQSISRFRHNGLVNSKKQPLLVTIQTNNKNTLMKHIIEEKLGFVKVGEKYYRADKTDCVYFMDLGSKQK